MRLSSVAKEAPGIAPTISVAPPEEKPKSDPGVGAAAHSTGSEVKLPPSSQGGLSRWPSLSGSPVGSTPQSSEVRVTPPPLVAPEFNKLSAPLSLKTEPIKPPPLSVPEKKATVLEMPTTRDIPKAPEMPKTPEMPVISEKPRVEPPKKAAGRQIPPIKLNEPSTSTKTPSNDSIFNQIEESAAAPSGWKSLEAGELKELAAGALDTDIFAQSQRVAPKNDPATTVPQSAEKKLEVSATPPESKPEEKAPSAAVPASAGSPGPASEVTAKPASSLPVGSSTSSKPKVLPPPLPVKSKEDKTALHVAPRMTESEGGNSPEKRRQPHLPSGDDPVEGKLAQPHLPSDDRTETGKLAQPHLPTGEHREGAKLPQPHLASSETKGGTESSPLVKVPELSDPSTSVKTNLPPLSASSTEPDKGHKQGEKLAPPHLPTGENREGAKLPQPHLASSEAKSGTESSPLVKVPELSDPSTSVKTNLPPLSTSSPESDKGHKHEEGKLAQPHLPTGEHREGAKLPQPHLASSEAKSGTESSPLVKVPELSDPSTPVKTNLPPVSVAPAESDKGTQLTPVSKTPTSVLKVSGPIVLRNKSESPSLEIKPVAEAKVSPESKSPSSTQLAKVEDTKPADAKPADGKPALRPAVLPNKLLKANEAEAAKPQEDASKKTSSDQKETQKSDAPASSGTTGPITVAVTKTAENAVPAKSTATGAAAPAAGAAKTASSKAPTTSDSKTPPKKLPPTRAERAKKRKIASTITFYVILLIVGAGLYVISLRVSRETRVEGQIIPPEGALLSQEVWVVNDFRDSISGLAQDLIEERAPKLQEIQDRQEHVQRAQADIALRETRISDLQSQIKANKDKQEDIVAQAREATQHIWDNKGAEIDSNYESHLNQIKQAISDRAKSLKLDYQSDETYQSPEVWANAYRLALYQAPKGVDPAKEYEWINGQLKQWRDFLKSVDDDKEKLREEAAQIKLSPASKLSDLNASNDELQHRIDTALSEEEPIKTELQQARSDLDQSQTDEKGLDSKFFNQLIAVPEDNVIKHVSLEPNGRFGWTEDTPYGEGEKERHFWLFAKALQTDGTEYWTMTRITLTKDSTLGVIMEPDSFVSTKSILPPNVVPDDQK